MADEQLIIISSSPEPEEFIPRRLDKGKARATSDLIGDLRLGPDVEPIELDDVEEYADDEPLEPSGSGNGRIELELPEDPIEGAIAQVLGIIPNVDPAHVRTLITDLEPHQKDGNMSTHIISHLLEHPDYPKVESLKRKATMDDHGSSKRPKIDYLAENRTVPLDKNYIRHAIDRLLFIDFPYIPKDYVKKSFVAHNKLYAPAYLALRDDLKAGDKFVVKKTATRAETSRGKRKAVPDNPDLEQEQKWLVIYLEEEEVKNAEAAELAQCEAEGTGVECGCCFGDFPFSWMVQCPDAHLFCRECARRSAEECIGNRKTKLVCMDQSGCKLEFAESEVERFLQPKSLELWYRIRQELEIEEAQIPGLECCPFCSYAVVIENEQERLFRCENSRCEIVSCRECKKEDHLPKSCKEMEQDKVLDARHAVEEAMTKALMRNCPKCSQTFVKESGCNKMICPKCHTLSCYVCRKVIRGYEHFDQTPQGAVPKASTSKCPLWDSVDQRHVDEVKRAAEAAQEEYQRLHPEIEQNDLKVDLPAAPPAPPARPALPIIPGFPLVGRGGFLGPPLLQPPPRGPALAGRGRHFEGMLDPQQVLQDLRARQAEDRQRLAVAAAAPRRHRRR